MKVRYGFVSNSSSSSWICERCNEIYEEDNYNIYTCENCCIEFCSECVEDLKVQYNETKITLPDDSYIIKKQYCPYCNNEDMTDWAIIDYFRKFHNKKSKKELVEFILKQKKIKKVLDE